VPAGARQERQGGRGCQRHQKQHNGRRRGRREDAGELAGGGKRSPPRKSVYLVGVSRQPSRATGRPGAPTAPLGPGVRHGRRQRDAASSAGAGRSSRPSGVSAGNVRSPRRRTVGESGKGRGSHGGGQWEARMHTHGTTCGHTLPFLVCAAGRGARRGTARLLCIDARGQGDRGGRRKREARGTVRCVSAAAIEQGGATRRHTNVSTVCMEKHTLLLSKIRTQFFSTGDRPR
jgi:hypothetical protein